MDTEHKQPEEKPYKRPTPVRRLQMDDVLWHDAEIVAKDLERSASWVIREALKEYVERHRANKRKERGKPEASRRRDRNKTVKH